MNCVKWSIELAGGQNVDGCWSLSGGGAGIPSRQKPHGIPASQKIAGKQRVGA